MVRISRKKDCKPPFRVTEIALQLLTRGATAVSRLPPAHQTQLIYSARARGKARTPINNRWLRALWTHVFASGPLPKITESRRFDRTPRTVDAPVNRRQLLLDITSHPLGRKRTTPLGRRIVRKAAASSEAPSRHIAPLLDAIWRSVHRDRLDAPHTSPIVHPPMCARALACTLQ